MEKFNNFLKLPNCPKCGSERIRDSSKRYNKSLFNLFFYDSYRCKVCRYHFENVRPSRIFLSVSILIFFVSMLVLNIVQFKYQTTSESFTQKIMDSPKDGNAEAELEMGLSKKLANQDEAAQWFEKSAKHGNTTAKYYYGLALFEGNGIIQSYKEGVYWLEQAAKAGHAKAQFTMGDIYHRGVGVPRDDLQSYLWFTLAAAKNESEAMDIRDQIARSLSLEQITLMQIEAKKIATNQNQQPLTAQK